VKCRSISSAPIDLDKTGEAVPATPQATVIHDHWKEHCHKQCHHPQQHVTSSRVPLPSRHHQHDKQQQSPIRDQAPSALNVPMDTFETLNPLLIPSAG
jgi:hypothetical protein